MNKRAEKKYATQELAPRSKKMTSKGKKNTSSPNSRHTKSLQTSEVESISKEKVLLPFWNESYLDTSKKLWLPTKTDCADLDLTLLRGCAQNSVLNSWFSTRVNVPHKKNSLKTCSPLLLFSPAVLTGSGSILLRSRKIRIYPTKVQHKVLEEWLYTSRYYYNKTVELFTNETAMSYVDTETGEIKQGFFVRPVSRTQKDAEGETFQVFLMNTLKAPWNERIPYKIKQMALEDAYKGGRLVNDRNVLYLNGNPNNQEGPSVLSFRKKKFEDGSIYVSGDNVSLSKVDKWKLRVHVNSLGELKFKDSLETRDLIANGEISDGNITLENGKWFLNLPFKVETKVVDNQDKMVSLDPGVRTFLTAYSPNSVSHFAEKDFKRITALLLWSDKLQSRQEVDRQIWKRAGSSRNFKKWMKSKLKWRLSMERIRNLTKEVHFKVARHLCLSYSTIILPTTGISNIVSRVSRKIRSETVRNMLTWAYYRFSEILKSKAKELGVRILRIGEEFTSKTCTNCGSIHVALGGNKVFKCPSCNVILDRDINGARNIFLKAMCEQEDL